MTIHSPGKPLHEDLAAVPWPVATPEDQNFGGVRPSAGPLGALRLLVASGSRQLLAGGLSSPLRVPPEGP